MKFHNNSLHVDGINRMRWNHSSISFQDRHQVEKIQGVGVSSLTGQSNIIKTLCFCIINLAINKYRVGHKNSYIGLIASRVKG